MFGLSLLKKIRRFSAFVEAKTHAWKFREALSSATHGWRIKSARRRLTTLRTGDQNFSQMFSYLREIEPLIFQEMILTACKDLGFPIRRPTRYTKDGGLDGEIFVSGRWHGIQAKRYTGKIPFKHIKAMYKISRKQRPVVIVQCGSIEPYHRDWIDNKPYLYRIGGQALLDLLHGRKLVF